MQQAGFAWLAYALMTVFAWGAYGNLLHTGQLGMGDPVNGRYKAFLFVGIAYFLVAVLAPIAVLVASNANWNLPMKGAGWVADRGLRRRGRSIWHPAGVRRQRGPLRSSCRSYSPARPS